MKLSKNIYLLILLILVVSCKTVTPAVSYTEKSTFEKLAAIPNVVSIEKRETVSHFDENYEIWFEQLIDHNKPEKGTFRQRVFLGFENP